MDDAMATAVAMEPYEKQGLVNSRKPRKEENASRTSGSESKKNGTKNNQQNSKTAKGKNAPKTDASGANTFFLKWAEDQSEAKPDIQCYYCKKQGHYKKLCPTLLAKLMNTGSESSKKETPSEPTNPSLK